VAYLGSGGPGGGVDVNPDGIAIGPGGGSPGGGVAGFRGSRKCLELVKYKLLN